MKNHFNLIDNDFILQRHGRGFKTIRPEKIANFTESHHQNSVATISESPFCLYFLNTHSQTVHYNPEALCICGFDSMKEARGKTMFDITNEEIAMQVIEVHQRTIRLGQPQFAEEEIICKDNRFFQCVTCVFPWYDENNQIIGILGSSIIPEQHNLPAALNTVFNLGFLNDHPVSNPHLKNTINSIYFSKRENQCIRLLMQGYSAKMIGAALQISNRTVEHYIENIKNKLGVSTKQDLIHKLRDDI